MAQTKEHRQELKYLHRVRSCCAGCVSVQYFRIGPRLPSLRQCRPTLSRWTVRGSYKSHGRSAAACPGLHDSQYPPSATSLLSFLSHSQDHCSRDRGLLPGKKAESVPRLRYFGQDSENKVSVVRVVGGALAAGGVPLPLPLSSEPSTLWCSPPSPAHFWLQLWCLEPSEVSPGTCAVGIPLGR